MFENLGKRIQSILLIIIIALLVVVMGVIGFGTPTGEGCNPRESAYAATVYGETITQGAFRAAYVARGFDRVPIEHARAQRLRHYMLEGLIERELLVREALELGFDVDPDTIVEHASRDQIIFISAPVDAPMGFPSGPIEGMFNDRDGHFSNEIFRATIQNLLRRSIEEFVDWQVHETLAQRMRDTVTAGVTVSPREVWSAYVDETERATISYARFNPTYYRSRVALDDAALTAWMGQHRSEVDNEYRRQRHRYTNLPAQARARHILIRVEQDASEADRASARQRAEGLLRRALAGEDFAALARANSDDTGSAVEGGDLGWFERGRMVPAFEQAAFSLAAGEIKRELVESTFGYHIIRGEGRREGNVPEAQAKREVAGDLYRRARAGELAAEDARRALAFLREGHTTAELDRRLRNNWAEAPAQPEPAPESEDEDGDRGTLAPRVSQSQSFGRSERAIAGPFDSSPITRAAFEMTTDHPLPDAPVRLGEEWVVYRLDERTQATQVGFTREVRERIEQSLLDEKRRETLAVYVGQLRQRAEAAGEIRRNPEVLRYGDEDDEEGEEGQEGEGESESASR